MRERSSICDGESATGLGERRQLLSRNRPPLGKRDWSSWKREVIGVGIFALARVKSKAGTGLAEGFVKLWGLGVSSH